MTLLETFFKNNSIPYVAGNEDKLADAFAQEVAQYNLLDENVYDQIFAEISSWEPGSKLQEYFLFELQNVQEQQQLGECERLSRQYLAHLEENILKESYNVCRTDHNYYFNPASHATGVDQQQQRGISGFIMDYERESSQIPKSDNLSKLINKHKIMTSALALVDRHQEDPQPAKQQIENFKGLIANRYTVLAERRDNGFMSFMKKLVNMFSLGFLGKTKGEELAQEIQSVQESTRLNKH